MSSSSGSGSGNSNNGFTGGGFEKDGFNKDSILGAAEEAKNAPLKFLPGERAKYVEDQINEIFRLKRIGKDDGEIRQLMGRFAEDYPTLFLKAIDPAFDTNQLKVMLALLNHMNDGNMSQHQASMIVGQRLIDKYVKGKVYNTTN